MYKIFAVRKTRTICEVNNQQQKGYTFRAALQVIGITKTEQLEAGSIDELAGRIKERLSSYKLLPKDYKEITFSQENTYRRIEALESIEVRSFTDNEQTYFFRICMN